MEPNRLLFVCLIVLIGVVITIVALTTMMTMPPTCPLNNSSSPVGRGVGDTTFNDLEEFVLNDTANQYISNPDVQYDHLVPYQMLYRNLSDAGFDCEFVLSTTYDQIDSSSGQLLIVVNGRTVDGYIIDGCVVEGITAYNRELGQYVIEGFTIDPYTDSVIRIGSIRTRFLTTYVSIDEEHVLHPAR